MVWYLKYLCQFDNGHNNFCQENWAPSMKNYEREKNVNQKSRTAVPFS